MDGDVDEDDGDGHLGGLEHPERERRPVGPHPGADPMAALRRSRGSRARRGGSGRLAAGPSARSLDAGGAGGGGLTAAGGGGLGTDLAVPSSEAPSSRPFLNSFWAEPRERASLGIWVEPNRTRTTTTRMMMPSTPKISAGAEMHGGVSFVGYCTRLDLSDPARCARRDRTVFDAVAPGGWPQPARNTPRHEGRHRGQGADGPPDGHGPPSRWPAGGGRRPPRRRPPRRS